MLEIRESVELAPFTTFKIGGPADYFCDIRTNAELREALVWAKDNTLPFTVLAGGSNVLIPDGGIKGLVIHICDGSFTISRLNLDMVLEADFGCDLLSLIRAAAQRGLGDWERLAGIPGTIGGAIRGNAGAFGTEIKDVAISVDAMNAQTFEMKAFTNAACDFSYRHSFFKDHPEWIVTRVRTRLSERDPEQLARSIGETIAEREKRHLQNVQAAGSFFMNPEAPEAVVRMFEKEKGVKSRGGRVPAGWLIEKAGYKGARVGGAVASEQHPNYLVNVGGATAHDVRNLAQQIKLDVFAQFGVELYEEAALL